MARQCIQDAAMDVGHQQEPETLMSTSSFDKGITDELDIAAMIPKSFTDDKDAQESNVKSVGGSDVDIDIASLLPVDVPLESFLSKEEQSSADRVAESQEPDAEIDPQAPHLLRDEMNTPVFSASLLSITPSDDVEEIAANCVVGEVLQECISAEAAHQPVEVVPGSDVMTRTPTSMASAIAADMSADVAVAAAKAAETQVPVGNDEEEEEAKVIAQVRKRMSQVEEPQCTDKTSTQDLTSSAPVQEAQGDRPGREKEATFPEERLVAAEPEPESSIIDFLKTVIRTGAATPATLRDLAARGQPFRGTIFTDNDVVQAIRQSSSFWVIIPDAKKSSRLSVDHGDASKPHASVTTASIISSVKSVRNTQATQAASKGEDVTVASRAVESGPATMTLMVAEEDVSPKSPGPKADGTRELSMSAADAPSVSEPQVTEDADKEAEKEAVELLRAIESRSAEPVVPHLFRLAYANKQNDLRWEMGQLYRVEPATTGLPDEVKDRNFSISPDLPAGITLDKDTGAITGVPEQPLVRSFFEILCRCRHMTGQDIVRYQASAHIILTVVPPTTGEKKEESRTRFSEVQVEIPKDALILSVEDREKAFSAIRRDDMNPLVEMVKNGTLKLYHLRSGKIVDNKGQTLWECAHAVHNRRALNFFKNGFVGGPSFGQPNPKPASYKPPYLSPMFPEAPPGMRPNPAHGVNPRIRRLVEARTPATPHTLTYPTLPKVLVRGKHVRFDPVHGTSGRSGACNQLNDLHKVYSICPVLPPELRFDQQSGCIYGTPSREMTEHVFEVTALLGESKAVVKSSISFCVIAPPQGLSFPSAERVFEIPSMEDYRGTGSVSPGGGSILPQIQSPSRSSQVKRPRHPASKSATKPSLYLKPHLMEGWADFYEVWPELPAGMTLDSKTGEIQGIPKFEHAHPVPHHQSFAVYARNPAGACACSVQMEACGGAWDLMCIKFFTESTRIMQGDDIGQPEFYRSAASSPKGRTTDRSQGVQDSRLRDLDIVDWGHIVEKCALVLKDHGDLMHIKDVNAAVKAMHAKHLMKCVGLEVEELTLGLMLRFIEQRGHTIDKVHLPGGQAQIRAAWRDSDAPVVYLHCEGGPLDGFAEILLKDGVEAEEEDDFDMDDMAMEPKLKEQPSSPSQRLTLSRQDNRVRTTQGNLIYKHQMPHEIAAQLREEREKDGRADKDKEEVNSSFHSLLPNWRSKLEDHKGFTQRRSALQDRWKGCGKEFSDR
eukprot:gnl/MRDRNA2_/MRDRNA2_30899_c0_seq1.p1 gnl/MRDRNA2_/MRDRNA2_30899_c0~~gnl/MRDRNA2_/MRDRNA2_30899_c0_seq1.p1  ORF type:complete len:1323 (+),score=279.94 gnl/MRDRNA2_/MRDRNA2_30899_c0_seq1:273-3971(+)